MVDITTSALFATDGKGLTLQEAEEVLHRALKYEQELQKRIASHDFVSETVEHLDGSNLRTIKKGESENGLLQIRSEVDALLKLKGLQTRLNTAVSLLKQCISEVTATTLKAYSEKKGEPMKDCINLQEFMAQNNLSLDKVAVPEVHELTEAEALCDLDVKTRARMLTLNATAAAIGGSIHPSGSFATAREELMTAMSAPCEVSPVGQVAVITSVNPTVSLESVDKVFFDLQNRHRELEAEDNRIRTSIQQKIREDKLQQLHHQKKIQEANSAKTSKLDEVLKRYKMEVTIPYEEGVAQLEKELEEWRSTELERLENLSVVIPLEMKSTLADVNRL